MSEPLNILLIGKSPGDLREMLCDSDRDVELIHCERSRDGLTWVSGGGVDVVLLDISRRRGTATLGLFIVRALVERYGGTIRVEDRVEGRPDLGAAFRFTLHEGLPAGDDEDDGYPDGEECE